MPKPIIILENRNGKKVTIIKGLHTYGAQRLEEIAKELKTKLVTGGTVKNGVIEIQGIRQSEIEEYFRNICPSLRKQHKLDTRFRGYDS